MKLKKYISSFLLAGALTTVFCSQNLCTASSFSDGEAAYESFSSGADEEEPSQEPSRDFSDELIPDLVSPALADHDRNRSEDPINLYNHKEFIGTFSTLDEAAENMTDSAGIYELRLSGDYYELNKDFPASYGVTIKYVPDSSSSDAEGSVIQVNIPTLKLSAPTTLNNVSMYFDQPVSTLNIGSRTLTLSNTSLICASAEQASDKLFIVGDRDSKINLYGTTGTCGLFGAELNIGTLYTQNGQYTLCSDNSNHKIHLMQLSSGGVLCFTDRGLSPSSQNTLTTSSITLSGDYDLVFTEGFHCTVESGYVSAGNTLYLNQVSEQLHPDWSTFSFTGIYPSPERMDFQYIIQSDQDCSDAAVFFNGTPALVSYTAYPNIDFNAHYSWVKGEDPVFDRSLLLDDNGTGVYHPDVNYQFRYKQIGISNVPIPQPGDKVGNTEAVLTNGLSEQAQILSAVWSSPDEDPVFCQGKTYELILTLANRQNVYGKFTGQEEVYLTMGNNTIAGTAEVSDANQLTARFSYTIDRITTLPKTTLKSAKCLGGSSVSVTWQSVPNASGYRVYRKEEGKDTSWKRLKNITVPYTLSYKDTTVKPGITYCYTIRAFRNNPDGTTTWGGYNSRGVKVKTYIFAPALIKAKSTESGIQITWNRTERASKYRIYRRTSSSDWKYLGNVSSSCTTFYDKTIALSGTYYYTVKGVYGNVSGKYQKPGLKCTIPKLTAPKLLSAKWESKTIFMSGSRLGVSTKWTPVKGAQYYYIYRKKAGSSKWILLKKQPASYSTSYFDSTASFGTSYYYTVKPVICKYYGDYSRSGIYIKKHLDLNL